MTGRFFNWPTKPAEHTDSHHDAVHWANPDFAERELITPEKAQRWLDRNPKNRQIYPSQVRKLVNAILMGEWRFNGDTIKLTPDEQLFDGQHRLLAIVEAGIACPSLVWRGASVTELDLLISRDEEHKKQSFGDLLHALGWHDAHYLAAVVKLHRMYKRAGDFPLYEDRDTWASKRQMYDWLVERPDLKESNNQGRRIRQAFGGGAMWAVIHYECAQIDDLATTDFFAILLGEYDGELLPNHPIFQLRKRLTGFIGDDRAFAVRRREMAALAFKAWNYWRDGRHIGSLKWQAGGAHPEPFPRPH